MNRLIVIAVLALTFSATSAQAEGPYISANLGYSMATDSDLSASGINFLEVSFDSGFNVGAALGYDYGYFRAEGEIIYHTSSIDQVTIPGFTPSSATGDLSALSFMVNGYYDFSSLPFEPYLGAGIGLASLDIELDDTALAFAYQFMAGIGFDFSPVTTMTLGYRYFATDDPEFDVIGVPIEATIAAHEFNIGIRFGF